MIEREMQAEPSAHGVPDEHGRAEVGQHRGASGEIESNVARGSVPGRIDRDNRKTGLGEPVSDRRPRRSRLGEPMYENDSRPRTSCFDREHAMIVSWQSSP
jgi:hypothetical protein